MTDFRLPGTSERVAVIGRTGSGKTRLATWLLSHAAYDKLPYIILDFKGEDLFDNIDRLTEIDHSHVPKAPGLYRLTPRVDQGDATEAWLWKVWERGKTGLYFDETLQVPGHYKAGALRAILTQGRSKKIPSILATQRPSGISPYIFSEADHFACFHLNLPADIQRVNELMPNARMNLPEYHSSWYDVKSNKGFTLAPVESDEAIVDRFNMRLQPKRKIL